MSGANEMARNLLAQEPGRNYRHAIAADTQKIARPIRQRHNSGTSNRITPSAGETFRIMAAGRKCWAVEELRRVGARRCTPIGKTMLRSGASFDLNGGAV